MWLNKKNSPKNTAKSWPWKFNKLNSMRELLLSLSRIVWLIWELRNSKRSTLYIFPTVAVLYPNTVLLYLMPFTLVVNTKCLLFTRLCPIKSHCSHYLSLITFLSITLEIEEAYRFHMIRCTIIFNWTKFKGNLFICFVKMSLNKI